MIRYNRITLLFFVQNCDNKEFNYLETCEYNVPIKTAITNSKGKGSTN